MIRHALPSCTVTATSGSVHGATTRSYLIAPPSFPLVLAAGILRAGSEAVDLAAIAVPTDKNLRAAATTQKQSARHFIGAVRHINPQPSAVSSSLQPRADRACRRARASQGQALRVAAKTRPALTGPARDGCAIWRSGRKNARGAGRTKEWNLRTQYPNRYSIFAAPHRRRHVRYQSGSPFTREERKSELVCRSPYYTAPVNGKVCSRIWLSLGRKNFLNAHLIDEVLTMQVSKVSAFFVICQV
jgi:hypothetical protein